MLCVNIRNEAGLLGGNGRHWDTCSIYMASFPSTSYVPFAPLF